MNCARLTKKKGILEWKMKIRSREQKVSEKFFEKSFSQRVEKKTE